MSSTNVMLAILSLTLLGMASAQVKFAGTDCPRNVTVMSDFDVEQFLGTWYEYEKYENIAEVGSKCISATYNLLADNSTVDVTIRMVNNSGSVIDTFGHAFVVADAKLLVTMQVSYFYNVTSRYWVLDTDYTSYSVIYSCTPIPEQKHAVLVWIFTRERQPGDHLKYKGRTVLIKNGISLKELEKTDQDGCP